MNVSESLASLNSVYTEQMNVLLEYLNIFDGPPRLDRPLFYLHKFLQHFTANLEASLEAHCHISQLIGIANSFTFQFPIFSCKA